MKLIYNDHLIFSILASYLGLYGLPTYDKKENLELFGEISFSEITAKNIKSEDEIWKLKNSFKTK